MHRLAQAVVGIPNEPAAEAGAPKRKGLFRR
jgi:hypothetical protein